MLSAITQKEFDQYLDFAYRLALDPAKSGYPTYTDHIKTREDFLRTAREGLVREQDEILLYRQAGHVEGWIHYFREPGDQYLETCVFNIRSGTAAAMDAFLSYLADRFPGYHAYLGFPEENQAAIQSLYGHGFQCNESSYNNSFFLDTCRLPPAQGDIRRIHAADYQDFRLLHAPYDGEMYWDCAHILDDLPRWNIQVYYRDQAPAGAIYFRLGGPMLEIFGVDFPDDVFDEEVYRALLIRTLWEGKQTGAEYLTYFSDERGQPVALELGFHCVGKYLCFDRIL